MENRSFLVQFEHLKIQEAILDILAAWYFILEFRNTKIKAE